MAILQARLRNLSLDIEWNFGGGRYLDSTTTSIKLPPLSHRSLSDDPVAVTVTKMAHGKLAGDDGSQKGPVNTYCVANPACVAVFNWRGCSASVVQVSVL